MENFVNWFVIPFWVWYIVPTVILVIAIVLFFLRKKSEQINKTKNLLFIIALICFNIVSLLVINNMISAIAPFMEHQQAYSYARATHIEIDDRSFVLEDLPENSAEEAVVMDFMYTITGDFDKKLDVIADTDAHRTSIDSEKKHFAEDVYIKSYVIHNIKTLSEEQYSEEFSTDGSINPLFYNNLQNLLDEYSLSEYRVVNVDFTMLYSEKALSWGPQWGEGINNRSFLVGKVSASDNYKIYDFGGM